MTRKSSTCFGKNGEPLSAYSTEAEALESSHHQKMERKVELFPRKCERCGEWHLTPVNGKPNQCSCTDSNGKSKYLYPTREAAEQQLEREASRGHILRIYPCDEGKGWHLTHTSGW